MPSQFRRFGEKFKQALNINSGSSRVRGCAPTHCFDPTRPPRALAHCLPACLLPRSCQPACRPVGQCMQATPRGRAHPRRAAARRIRCPPARPPAHAHTHRTQDWKPTSNARNLAMIEETRAFAVHLKLLQRDLGKMEHEVEGAGKLGCSARRGTPHTTLRQPGCTTAHHWARRPLARCVHVHPAPATTAGQPPLAHRPLAGQPLARRRTHAHPLDTHGHMHAHTHARNTRTQAP